MSGHTPYSDLEPSAFWRTAVADKSAFDINGLWEPKYRIRDSHNVATYGSCFAQYFGQALKSNGYRWLISEKAPAGVSSQTKTQFNYDVFSSRTGNIYTTSLLRQWVQWALGEESPRVVWEKDGRYYDPFRPRVEPNGFSSEDEVYASRQVTVNSFKESIEHADIFVFTLGLTERWMDKQGFEYPMCPGTVAGDFIESEHRFSNMSFIEVRKELNLAITLMRQINPNLRLLLTVSPVPLTATKADRHVLVSTVASKSILRAVADDVAGSKPYIDYFPSYEIISGIPFKSMFYQPNLRNVNMNGVNFVMQGFFRDLHAKYPAKKKDIDNKPQSTDTKFHDEVCEEELLEAFGK